MRLSGDFFWGLLFIVIGVALVTKYVFHFNIPVLRIVFGFILIYLGLSVLFGGSLIRGKGDIIFGSDSIRATDAKDEYNIIFGSGTVDLTDMGTPSTNRRIDVNTIFSSGNIKIRGDVPIVIKVDSAFSASHFPNGTTISFGDYTYKTRGYREREPYILIEADVVFGQFNIIEI